MYPPYDDSAIIEVKTLDKCDYIEVFSIFGTKIWVIGGGSHVSIREEHLAEVVPQADQKLYKSRGSIVPG